MCSVHQKFFPIGWYYLHLVFKDPIQKKAITEDEPSLNTFRTENFHDSSQISMYICVRIRPFMSNSFLTCSCGAFSTSTQALVGILHPIVQTFFSSSATRVFDEDFFSAAQVSKKDKLCVQFCKLACNECL